MNFFHFPLVLTPEQVSVLKQEYQLFSDTLEKQQMLHPEYISGLTFRLRQILDGLQITNYEQFRKGSEVQHNLAHFTHDNHELLNLPWHLAIGEAEHLYFSRGTGLRDKKELPPFKPENTGPLRILIMIAAPETDGEIGRLRYEDEQMQIAEAFGQLLGRGDIEIHFTADGSEAALRQALDAPRYDIFHFSGHSEYTVADWMQVNQREGFLLLEDERSMAVHKLPAAAFAALLNERPDKRPSLVFLSSCQSAQGGSGSFSRNSGEGGGYSGVTSHLLEAGIPGVVAMSQSVTDVYATLFAAAFYKNIAEGLSVPLSFSKALRTTQKGNGQSGLPPEFWFSQSLIPQLYLTHNLENLSVSGSKGNTAGRRSANFWQTGRLRDKLQKLHQFAGRTDRDFIFIGRRREQKEIRRHMDEAATVYLRGQGGIGKTALAVHTTERLVLADPDEAQVFMFDENNFRIEQVTNELLDFLKNEKQQVLLAHQIKSLEKAWDKFLTALQEVLNRCKPVFIFDNLESMQPTEEGGDFRPEYSMEWDILQTLAEMGVPLILTGRYPLPELPNLRTVALHEPSRSDFAVKCRYLSISEKIPAGEAGKPVFETLFRSIGGNYRALEFFDTFYQEQKEGLAAEGLPKAAEGEAFGQVLYTLGAYIQQYQADPEKLARMSENLVFEQLLDLLDANGQTALALLAQFRRPVLPLALEMQKPDLPDAATQLERLAALTLTEKTLDEAGNAFFYVPTLTRLLLERAGRLSERLDEQKAGAYYEYVVDNITSLVADLEEAFFHFLRTENVEKVNKTGDQLSSHLHGNSQYQQALLVAGQTFEVCGGETAGGVLNRLGLIFKLFGEGDRALFFYQKKLKIDHQTGDQQGEGVTLNNISQIHKAKGDYDTALGYLDQSLKIMQAIGDLKGEGTTLNNISLIHSAKGDYDTALGYLEQSLKIKQAIGDRAGEGATLNNISQIHSAKGDYDTALGYLEQSLKITQAFGDRAGEGATLNNISQIHDAKGDYDTALGYLEQSLKIQQAIGDREGEGRTLNNISQIHSAKGDYDTALGYLEQSLKIRQAIGDRKGESVTLNNIGQIHQARGNYDEALRYAEIDLKICQAIGDRAGEGTTLNNLATMAYAKGDYDTALGYLEQSLKIQQAIGDRAGMATTLHNMGSMLFVQNRKEEALPLLMQAYQILEKIGSPNAKVSASYLNAIREAIGEARFQEIVAGME